MQHSNQGPLQVSYETNRNDEESLRIENTDKKRGNVTRHSAAPEPLLLPSNSSPGSAPSKSDDGAPHKRFRRDGGEAAGRSEENNTL